MATTVHCPQCSRELRVPDELIGKKVKCPACATTFMASVAGPEAALPPPGPSGYEEPATGEPRPAPQPGEYEDELPEEDYDRPRPSRARERVKGKVMAPAICLIIAASIGVIADAAQIVMSLGPPPQLPPPQPGEPEWVREFQKSSHGPIATGGGAVGVMFCGIIIFASIQMLRMRMWGFALAGTIMSMINCFNCCCVLGLPFGIWALIVLLNEEVKKAFQ